MPNKSKYGNCFDSPFPNTKFRQEGQGASSPTSAKVARPRKQTPTGNKPDNSLILGKTRTKASR